VAVSNPNAAVATISVLSMGLFSSDSTTRKTFAKATGSGKPAVDKKVFRSMEL
jgi:hypothetical protein